MLRCSRALRSVGVLSPARQRRALVSCTPKCQANAVAEQKAGGSPRKQLRSLAELNWDHTFTKELPCDPLIDNKTRKVVGYFSSLVDPTPTNTDPRTVIVSEEVANILDLDPEEAQSPFFAGVFSGNVKLEGSLTYAQNYGGHQFGTWAGQLGDGRAMTLGEIVNSKGERWEMQLKGAGKTPYSRRADGRAVLRSSIREFVASEAMAALGVPTTRALSLVATNDKVLRDMFYDGNAKFEPGAVVCRVAPSFVRIGTFELPSSRRQDDLVKQLLDYVVRHHYKEFVGEKDVAQKFLAELSRRTAVMGAAWQSVGFVHGVLNTDNTSALGLTIDYGPYGWARGPPHGQDFIFSMEGYDPYFTPNTTDMPGLRYCYAQQPNVLYWNLQQLAAALVESSQLSAEQADGAVEEYVKTIRAEFGRRMAAKMGLREHDDALLKDLLNLMRDDSADFTRTFRALAKLKPAAISPSASPAEVVAPLFEAVPCLKPERQAAWADWVRAYCGQLLTNGLPESSRVSTMNGANPLYVPRNYLLQIAIEAAEKGDYEPVEELMRVLRRPFEEQPGMEKYAAAAPEWAKRPGVSCLSCSS